MVQAREGPDPTLYERVLNRDGTDTLQFHVHGSRAEDPSEELRDAMRWLAVPQVFAVSGALDIVAH